MAQEEAWNTYCVKVVGVVAVLTQDTSCASKFAHPNKILPQDPRSLWLGCLSTVGINPETPKDNRPSPPPLQARHRGGTWRSGRQSRDRRSQSLRFWAGPRCRVGGFRVCGLSELSGFQGFGLHKVKGFWGLRGLRVSGFASLSD